MVFLFKNTSKSDCLKNMFGSVSPTLDYNNMQFEIMVSNFIIQMAVLFSWKPFFALIIFAFSTFFLFKK